MARHLRPVYRNNPEVPYFDSQDLPDLPQAPQIPAMPSMPATATRAKPGASMLPYLPSIPASNGPATPSFANPNVAMHSAADAEGKTAYLEAIQAGKSIPEAMRMQSIARNKNLANAMTGNAVLNRSLATDANQRANQTTGAQVRGTDAYTNYMIPALAAGAHSEANRNNADADVTRYMMPIQGTAQNLGIDQKRAELDRYKRLTPAVVRSTEAGLDDAAERVNAYRTLNRDLMQYARTAMPKPAAPKATSPRDMATINRMLLEAGRDEDAKRYVDSMLPALMPAVPATQPAAPNPAALMPWLPATEQSNDLPAAPSPATMLPSLIPWQPPTPSGIPAVQDFTPRNPDPTGFHSLLGPPQTEQSLENFLAMPLPQASPATQPATQPTMQPTASTRQPLSPAMARQILNEAGGDRQKAIRIALQRGFNPYK